MCETHFELVTVLEIPMHALEFKSSIQSASKVSQFHSGLVRTFKRHELEGLDKIWLDPLKCVGKIKI